MNDVLISNNFFEIIAGTSNKLHPAYMEAVNNVDKNTSKALGYLKNFITSIENVANNENVKDSRISSSKGNIRNFKVYEDIKTSMNFLKKNLGNVGTINNLFDIFNKVEEYQPQYSEGYEKNIRLVVLEYESSLDLLVTGLTMLMADNIDVVQNGTAIKIQKNKGSESGIIYKTISDLAKQLTDKNHKKYLDEMITAKKNVKVSTDIKESVTIMESAVSDTVDLIDNILSGVGRISHYTVNIVRTIKNSLFGILPLIRSCIYIRYKKRADTILALEQQAEFINKNIEQLENRTNIDEREKQTIIKKQKAIVEGYKKKAAKLRAELSDGEREAATAIKKEDPEIKNTDGDFVLENINTIENIFGNDVLMESVEITVSDEIKDKAASIVKKKLPDIDKIDFEIMVDNHSYCFDFVITIDGKKKNLIGLEDDNIIKQGSMDSEIKECINIIRKSDAYKKGEINKIKFTYKYSKETKSK